jgi:hypothetical protein
MPAKSGASVGALAAMAAELSDMNSEGIKWDTSPMTEQLWLLGLSRVLQKDKATRELFVYGWVLVQSKTAVESIMQARYLTRHPDISFDWTSPAPQHFSIEAYEARRRALTLTLDRWHIAHANEPDAEPPFHLSSYIPISDRPDDYNGDHINTTAQQSSTSMGIPSLMLKSYAL